MLRFKKIRKIQTRSAQRGATLLEFTFVAAVFLIMIVGIVSAGNLYFTHNALVEATRRGARYAVLTRRNGNPAAWDQAVKNVVVYGTPTPAQGATPVVYNLQTDNVIVTNSSFGVAQGTVSVTIDNYTFPFVLPTETTAIQMLPYRTTLSGECAGFIPPNL